MGGLATKMHTALLTIAETDHRRAGHQADRALRGLALDQLEAMDAAAEVMGRQELAQQVRVRPRATYRDSDDFDLCTHTISLSLQEEHELLATLLAREIQRRKEQGHG